MHPNTGVLWLSLSYRQPFQSFRICVYVYVFCYHLDVWLVFKSSNKLMRNVNRLQFIFYVATSKLYTKIQLDFVFFCIGFHEISISQDSIYEQRRLELEIDSIYEQSIISFSYCFFIKNHFVKFLLKRFKSLDKCLQHSYSKLSKVESQMVLHDNSNPG